MSLQGTWAGNMITQAVADTLNLITLENQMRILWKLHWLNQQMLEQIEG